MYNIKQNDVKTQEYKMSYLLIYKKIKRIKLLILINKYLINVEKDYAIIEIKLLFG